MHAQFLHNINMNMVSMSGTNWTAAAAAANNNNAGYGWYDPNDNDEDIPPANENAQPLPSASRSRPININPRTSSPVNVNHVNLLPAFPRFNDGSWMTSDGRRQAHPSVPMNVFVRAVPRLQPQPHQVHEHATHVQPMHNQMITPSPNFGMAYDDDVGFEQHFSAPVYQHPPIPTYAHGSSSPSLERSPKSKVLFVHNVPSEVTEDELRDLFNRHGTVVRVSISPGSIAFVHFRLQSEADEARLGLNEHRVSKIFGFIIITCIYINVNIILTVTFVCFSDSQQHLARRLLFKEATSEQETWSLRNHLILEESGHSYSYFYVSCP